MNRHPDEHLPEPLKSGRAGVAWRYDLEAMRRAAGTTTDDDATLVGWLVEVPEAHPFWHSYWLNLAHLRPMPDYRETLFYVEGATHELVLYALNADQPRKLDAAPGVLTPGNFAAQFIAADDPAAEARIEATVEEMVNGFLNPDTDALGQWVERFGDGMVKGGYRG